MMSERHGGPNPGNFSLLLYSNMAILSSWSLKPKPHNPSMPVWTRPQVGVGGLISAYIIVIRLTHLFASIRQSW